jgi:hypothetical protein
MRVDQAGSDSVALKVNDAQPTSLALELEHIGISTNLHDHTAADRQGLGYGIFRIDRKDVTVNQDEIGGGGLRRNPSGERQNAYEGTRQPKT